MALFIMYDHIQPSHFLQLMVYNVGEVVCPVFIFHVILGGDSYHRSPSSSSFFLHSTPYGVVLLGCRSSPSSSSSYSAMRIALVFRYNQFLFMQFVSRIFVNYSSFHLRLFHLPLGILGVVQHIWTHPVVYLQYSMHCGIGYHYFQSSLSPARRLYPIHKSMGGCFPSLWITLLVYIPPHFL